MSFLSPLLLGAILMAAVPILLHLFHRSEGKPLNFPALRYLHRTAREHARTIRTRQLLLLVLRVTAVVLLAMAAARPVMNVLGSGHPPTALVLVVDNSISSGAVVEEVRVLDRLLAMARRSVSASLPGDRIWILRAGEPWVAPRPLSPEEARSELNRIEVGPGPASLDSTLIEAVEIAATSGLEHGEIHLLSDLQNYAVQDLIQLYFNSNVEVVAFADEREPPVNYWLSGVLVGEGLPPLPGERTQLAFRLERSRPSPLDDAGLRREVRLDAQGRLRGSAQAEPAAEGALGMGPFSSGWVSGFSELDPDAFRADDRHYFAFQVREAVAVRVLGDPGPYANEALTVLEEAGRIRRVGDPGGEVQVELVGAAASAPSASAFVVLPPTEPSLLPSVNRGMAQAGLAVTFAPDLEVGMTALAGGSELGLEGLEIARKYELEAGENAGIRQLARTEDGSPWLVEASGSDARALIFASPLEPDWSELPFSARMIPVLDWALTRWGAGGSATSHGAWVGDLLPLPPSADAVASPDGSVHPLSGEPGFRALQGPGIYTVLRGDSVLDLQAVNVPPGESDLGRPGDLKGPEGLPQSFHVVPSVDDWSREIFRTRRGPELGWLLLILAAVVLAGEGLLAASGPRSTGRATTADDLLSGGTS